MIKNKQALKIKKDVLYGREIEPPRVNMDKCKGCGYCVKVCEALVFEIREKKSEVIRGEWCCACGHCWAVCPEEAVIHRETATDTTLKSMPTVSADALQHLIRERRSTRLFTDKPVTKELLLKIIEAGRYAPTASNRQSVNYVVLSEREKVSELRALVESFMEKTFKMIQNRAFALFVTMKFSRSTLDLLRYYSVEYRFVKENIKSKNAYFPLPFGSAVVIAHQPFDLMAQSNCSLALYNCSLMAHSLGLGSCFMGFAHICANMDKKVKRWLNIPKNHQCYGAMALGHPDVEYHRLVERKKPNITWL